MTDASGADRRSHARLDVSLPVRVAPVAGDTPTEVETVNISEGGVLLAGDDFPSGAVVRLEIELAEMGWHAIDAEVVRRGEDPARGQALAARFASVATEGGRDAIRAFFATRLNDAGTWPASP